MNGLLFVTSLREKNNITQTYTFPLSGRDFSIIHYVVGGVNITSQ